MREVTAVDRLEVLSRVYRRLSRFTVLGPELFVVLGEVPAELWLSNGHAFGRSSGVWGPSCPGDACVATLCTDTGRSEKEAFSLSAEACVLVYRLESAMRFRRAG